MLPVRPLQGEDLLSSGLQDTGNQFHVLWLFVSLFIPYSSCERPWLLFPTYSSLFSPSSFHCFHPCEEEEKLPARENYDSRVKIDF